MLSHPSFCHPSVCHFATILGNFLKNDLISKIQNVICLTTTTLQSNQPHMHFALLLLFYFKKKVEKKCYRSAHPNLIALITVTDTKVT